MVNGLALRVPFVGTSLDVDFVVVVIVVVRVVHATTAAATLVVIVVVVVVSRGRRHRVHGPES